MPKYGENGLLHPSIAHRFSVNLRHSQDRLWTLNEGLLKCITQHPTPTVTSFMCYSMLDVGVKILILSVSVKSKNHKKMTM